MQISKQDIPELQQKGRQQIQVGDLPRSMGTNGRVCWPFNIQFLVSLSQVWFRHGGCHSICSRVWNSNVVAVSKYYRTSGLRTKELKSTIPKVKSFPAHHEVRFAQHLIQLCEAVLCNLDGCRLHWQKIIEAPSGDYEKKEKDKARGFLKNWHPSSLQTWLTALMVDICSIFMYVEKECQKEYIILPDILRYRDVALQKLELLKAKPYPGNYDIISLIILCYNKS